MPSVLAEDRLLTAQKNAGSKNYIWGRFAPREPHTLHTRDEGQTLRLTHLGPPQHRAVTLSAQ